MGDGPRERGLLTPFIFWTYPSSHGTDSVLRIVKPGCLPHLRLEHTGYGFS